MRSILVLLRKDFSLLARNRAALLLTFIVPLVLIALFGYVFGLYGKDSGPAGIPLAVVDESGNPAAAQLLAALRREKAFRVITTRTLPDKSQAPLTEADLRPLMQDNRFRFALVLPRDLVGENELGLHLKILSNPRNDIETQTVNGLLQKTIFSHVPQLLGQSLQARAKGFLGGPKLTQFNDSIANTVAKTFGGDAAKIRAQMDRGDFGLGEFLRDDGTQGDGSAAGSDLFGQLVRIESEQVVGKDVRAAGATRVVGGWAVQFLLFAVSASAAALFYERDRGLFQRLLATPTTRAQVLWAKFGYGVILGLVQLLVLFTAGRFLYGIDVEHHFLQLALVSMFAAAACTAFGLLLAAFAPTPEAANGMATLVILLMSAVGGAWFPVTFMPEAIQTISKLTIVYWSMEGFSQVLWSHASVTELLPTLGVLGGTAAAVMAVAVWRFNRSQLFE